ncbi:hypothetical protein [Chondromyces apiculatus]|uniref:PEGA domain-containing protein n=1 Tax=Chondromyces apiculatus DSM 436 TaxID=1192034 RepID=A0A017TEE4_9BACT|nr:hypothetical protein [Chondromyces apiculatus]EYF07297.1 Hypothetical protein CAP_0776 [Chondromyces apiculatus DSM 436]
MRLHSSHVRAFALSFAAACALAVTPAAAQSPRDPAAAEALFQAAKADAAKGDWDSACAKLRQSQDLDPAPGTAFRLAECEEQRTRIATAWALYVEVEQRLGPDDERRPLVRERIEAIAPRVPYLTLRAAAGAPGDLEVLRDGVTLAKSALGLALPIDPGRHTLTVRAPGRKEQQFVVELKESEKKELEVAPGEVLPPVAPPGSSEGEGSSGMRTAGFIALGVGAAGAVVAGVTGGLLLSRNATLKDECPNNVCTPEGVDIRDNSGGLFVANYVGWGVGIAGVATGTVLLILSRGKEAPKQGRMSFGATPLPGGGAVLMRGSF